MIKLFLDLETLPAQQEWIKKDIIENVKPPANLKKAESIAKWQEEKGADAGEKEWLKTSFDGGAGEICTIGFALDESKAISIQRTDAITERSILQDFFDLLASEANNLHMTPRFMDIQWIGHNVIDFDLRFLYKRCVINNINTYGIKIPVDARHGYKEVYDTMKAWNGWQSKPGGSLDRICKLLDIKGKEGIGGAEVWPAFGRGEYEKIAEYCINDVEITREVYRRLTFQG